jgi:adenosylcobinamide-phosphate synthase
MMIQHREPNIKSPQSPFSSYRRRWLVMLLALLLDGTLDELPNRWHPVAWLGSLLAVARHHAPVAGHVSPFLYGLAVVSFGGLLCAAVGRRMGQLIASTPTLVGLLVEAFLLKQTLALRGLGRAGEAVATPLAAGELEEARQQLSWHLVSRDTKMLNPHQIAAATVESVAENTSDSVVAPLFYYGLFGLTGAFVYRYLNTIDAMWGYHDEVHEWLGKAGARADDLANLCPSRLTALLLIAASGRQMKQAWHIWQRDHRLTASPNAGHPMSAMAGALGVELVKLDHYQLGKGLSKPTSAHIGLGIQLMRRAVALGICLGGLWAGWQIVTRRRI